MTTRLVVLLLLLTGCAAGGTASADCSSRVRYEGRTYQGWGATTAPSRRLGRAELAACHDLEPGWSGDPFAEATPVRVLRLPGIDPTEAVGMAGPGFVTLLVAEGISGSRRNALVTRLTEARGPS